MTGRPSKRTPEVVAKVLTLVADPVAPLSLRAACSEAGIARSTWHAWEQDDRQLAEDRDIAVGKGQAALERKALDGAVEGPAANVLRHRLGCLDVENWGERKVDVPAGNSLADLMRADDADRKRDP